MLRRIAGFLVDSLTNALVALGPQTWRLAGSCLGAMALSLPAQTVAAQSTGTAIEYYHAGFNHYFITAEPAEAANLDGGAFGGVWSRTGQTFTVWTQAGPQTSEACRFFSAAFAPKSSHFYTPKATECSLLRAGQVWQYEGIAFHLRVPDVFGNCPAGTAILHRAYNNSMSGAPNHRYTTSRAVLDQMQSQGWAPEGDGANLAFACIPAASAVTGAHGLYFGTTNQNQTVWGIVLPEGTFYVLYSMPGSNYVAGVVQGSATFSNGAFGSSNARDFNITPYGNVYAASVSGTYVAGTSIQGTIAEGTSTLQFAAAYSPDSRTPSSLALAAGSYTGTVASSAGWQTASFTLTPTGGFAGNASGCTFSGNAVARSDINAFNISVRFNGGLCIFGTSTLNGVAVYDAANKQFYGAAPNSSRTDGLLFIGGK